MATQKTKRKPVQRSRKEIKAGLASEVDGSYRGSEGSPVYNTPTANVDAERTVLGAIFLDNACFEEVNKSVLADDFSLDSNRKIFLRMAELKAAGHVLDIVTLSEELARHKEIHDIGGVAYLASLTEGLPRRPVIDEYLRIIADKGMLRRMIRIAQETQTTAANGELAAPLLRETVEKLLQVAADCKFPNWRRPNRTVVEGARDFMLANTTEVEWTIERLIQRGGNGLMVGDPGTSKSLLALHMLLHLVTGQRWLGFRVPKPMRCALITREDHPSLTSQRMHRLIEGLPDEVVEALHEIELNECLYINSRRQTKDFSLSQEADVEEIIDAFKQYKIQFAVFDVFRRLWQGDENDNEQVANVLSTLTRIQTECDCSVALLHHLSKAEGNIFNRVRGASAIYGWREWAFGITVVNPEANPRDRVRKMVFETKADAAADPVHFRIEGFVDKLMIETCEAPRKETKSKTKEDREQSIYQSR